MELDIEAVRAHFPILSKRTYLNSCSLGALSDRAEEYLRDFLDHWHDMGASAWYEIWMGKLDLLRSRVGDLLNVPKREIALLPTTSAALSVVSESVDQRIRNKVVCTDLDFPTLVYQWRVKPEIELVVLKSPDGIRVYPEQFEEVVDDRTLFIATSHVFFATGFIQDLEALGSIARKAGAYSLIDGYQGAGQIPVDLSSSPVDFYTTGPLKWLCGGPGLSYLQVRSDLIERLNPRFTSWFAHEDQFAFDLDHFVPATDARRFELGTPALATVHTALGGQEILDEVGMERIRERNRHLTSRLMERLTESGFEMTVSPDPETRSAILMVRHPDPAKAVRSLAAEDIIVDHRPGHVRVSPHFYNTEEECDRFAESLQRLKESTL